MKLGGTGPPKRIGAGSPLAPRVRKTNLTNDTIIYIRKVCVNGGVPFRPQRAFHRQCRQCYRRQRLRKARSAFQKLRR